MKVSIVTVCYNSEATIEDTIYSVLFQDYCSLEYIIVDGDSTDGTLLIIDKYRDHISIVVSEPDDGIYDAMNKGIRLASGDVIGILNSDDFYVNCSVISDIVNEIEKQQVDSIIADLVIVDRYNTQWIKRYYRSSLFKPARIAFGILPPHPTFFVKRCHYERHGLYNSSYEISADFEMIARLLLKNRVSYCYLPKVIVKMRNEGTSTKSLKSFFHGNIENLRACRENGINSNYLKIYSKYFWKLFQYFQKPSFKDSIA